MFEPEFSNKKVWRKEPENNLKFKSTLPMYDVQRTQLLYWREHCLECAPPECYHSCHMYKPRSDRRCLRFYYGIYQNIAFEGMFRFGADLRFYPWAKLGTHLYNKSLTPRMQRILSTLDTVCSYVTNIIYRATNPFNPINWLGIVPQNPQRFTYKTYAYLRERLLHSLPTSEGTNQFEMFVIECYSFEAKPFHLQIEYVDGTPRYRHAIEINQGSNYCEIPIERFNARNNPPKGFINIYPESDQEVRLVITWLDFIQKVKKAQLNDKKADMELPASKVKCVAWDLDNTLWDGVLIEDGKDRIRIRNEVVQTILALDARGIIQTIASKNNYDEAWDILVQNGLQEYFIYPAINWATKSSNIKQIADKININLDTIALIDDSDFERAEVSTAFPQVRTYSDKEIYALLENKEFDVPITNETKMRRQFYLAQMDREQILEKFTGDYETFLKLCDLKMNLFKPIKEEHKKRCYELIQRSNQLNLSSMRYTEQEFDKLLNTKGVICIALHCKDKFGDYGIVGFVSVREDVKEAVITDFVISCRVAQKMVEHSFIEWLCDYEKKAGRIALIANLVKTKRNGPLVRIFDTLPFEIIEESEQIIKFYLRFDALRTRYDIIHITQDL